MREAITTVQMVLFKLLRQSVHDRYVDQTDDYHNQLAGAVINNLFGTQPLDGAITAFGAATAAANAPPALWPPMVSLLPSHPCSAPCAASQLAIS